MAIAAGRICLPHLHQSVRNTAAVLIEYASGNDNALTYRRIREVTREVVVGFANRVVAVERPGKLTERMWDLDQRLGWRAPHGRSVAFVQILRLRAGLRSWILLHSHNSIV